VPRRVESRSFDRNLLEPNDPFRDGFRNLLVDLVDRQVPRNENNTGRLAERNLAVLFPDSLVEGVLFGFEAGFVGLFLIDGALVAAPGSLEGDFEAG
jgi:hypothetical protein